MKSIAWLLGLLIIGALAWYGYTTYVAPTSPGGETTNEQPMATASAQITPVSHATGILQFDDVTIYFDPTGGEKAFTGRPAPDIVLVTDIHGDHLSTSTLAEVAKTATLVVPEAVQEMLPPALRDRAKVLANGDALEEQGLIITAVPMYNLPESENADFHTPGRGNGYIVEKNGTRVYIAGDTAGTPEMRALQNIAIALVPMNLPYTMSVAEAADAVLAFKPRQVIPYHYRGQDGVADVQQFKQLVNAGDANIQVNLLEWYPTTAQ